MNTMKLAWVNAQAAQNWHGVGTKKEYFGGSLKLAHAGRNLRNEILAKVAMAGAIVFACSFTMAALFAQGF